MKICSASVLKSLTLCVLLAAALTLSYTVAHADEVKGADIVVGATKVNPSRIIFCPNRLRCFSSE